MYTIGREEVYDKCFTLPDPVIKLGRTDDYEGGSIWGTIEEARQYILKKNLDGYAVYRVDGNLKEDSEEVEGVSYRVLLRDREVICKVWSVYEMVRPSSKENFYLTTVKTTLDSDSLEVEQTKTEREESKQVWEALTGNTKTRKEKKIS